VIGDESAVRSGAAFDERLSLVDESVGQRLGAAVAQDEAAVGSEALLDVPGGGDESLKELERAGLVTQRRESRNIIYAANYATMRALLSYLMEDCCGGRPEICDIDVKCCAA